MISKCIPCELRDFAVILVGIVPMVGENDVGIDPGFEADEPSLRAGVAFLKADAVPCR